MFTKSVDLNEFRKRFTELLSLILSGTEIVLTQDETPIARITPIAPSRTAGLHSGAIWTSDDFDEPLPESF